MPRKKNGLNPTTGLVDIMLTLPVKPCFDHDYPDCFVVYIKGKPHHMAVASVRSYINDILKFRDKKLKQKYRKLALKKEEGQKELN